MPTTDIMDVLPISDVSFMLNWQQEMSQQSGGSPRTADVGEELWLAKIGCNALTKQEARIAEAMLDGLRGAIDTFYVWNARAPYPFADLTGAVLGASAVTIYALGGDNKSLRLAGLPVGYVLSIGDYLSFDTGNAPNVRRCLHRLTSGGTADGAGRTGFMSVTPHIRAGAANGLAVSLKKPAAEMFVLPGTLAAQSLKGSLGTLSFQALQVP
jgi:hypothetical protein